MMIDSEFDLNASVWLTGFWGFDPEEEGVLGFTDSRDRDRFISQIDERQLVCIYGAASPETDTRLVHHLLGVIDVERTPIDSWDKISETARQRNIDLGWRDKWRHAMPVRRAWRTKHTLDVKQVFPRSYDPANGRYIARFGTWLHPDEARWLLTKAPFTPTNVFGEPPLTDPAALIEAKPLIGHLRPSRAVLGEFGERTTVISDRPHHLYLASFGQHAQLLAGRRLERGEGLFKIGVSGDIRMRLKALNLSFPVTAEIGWTMLRQAQFPDRETAVSAEARFKELAVSKHGGASLGREFFLMRTDRAERLFNDLSPATGLDIRVGR